MNEPVSIGLAEMAVSHDPQDVLVTYGLGSCVAVGMWEPQLRLAGMLHAVLPEHANGVKDDSPKFVTSGIEALLAAMERLGANRRRLIIRMAGGANMLAGAGLAKTFNIGGRNIQAARLTLDRLGLRLQAERVGGNSGRTVRLYVADGRMTIRTMGSIEEGL